MQDIDGHDDGGRFDGDPEEGMGDAAMVLEPGDRATQAPKGVDVGKFSRDDHGQCGVGSMAIQAGTREARASEEVRDRFHRDGFSGRLRIEAEECASPVR